jgi:hypothetical protein
VACSSAGVLAGLLWPGAAGRTEPLPRHLNTHKHTIITNAPIRGQPDTMAAYEAGKLKTMLAGVGYNI